MGDRDEMAADALADRDEDWYGDFDISDEPDYEITGYEVVIGHDPMFEVFVCPVCRGTRTIQPDPYTPAEPCPRCVDPDEGA